MGQTMFEIMLPIGAVALVFIFPTVWWHICYQRARKTIIRLWDEGSTDSLGIYTFPFPHVVTREPGDKEEYNYQYRTFDLDTWVDESGALRSIPIFGISSRAFG